MTLSFSVLPLSSFLDENIRFLQPDANRPRLPLATLRPPLLRFRFLFAAGLGLILRDPAASRLASFEGHLELTPFIRASGNECLNLLVFLYPGTSRCRHGRWERRLGHSGKILRKIGIVERQCWREAEWLQCCRKEWRACIRRRRVESYMKLLGRLWVGA